jgi:hypothetical protein
MAYPMNMGIAANPIGSSIPLGNSPPVIPFSPAPPPQPPKKYPALPEKPSKEFQKIAQEYVAKFCKASRAYVRAKQQQWQLMDALYMSKIGIRGWQEWREGLSSGDDSKSRYSDSLLGYSDSDSVESTAWQSDYIHAPGYLVDSYTDQTYSSIFGGSDYLTVTTTETEPSTDPGTFPVAFKIQQLLINKLNQGHIHARLFECIQSCVCLGTVYAKVFWHSRVVPKYSWQMSFTNVEKITEPDVIYEAPIIQQIPLDNILPDFAASHNDIQRWRGIGHTVDRSYADIIDSYRSGDYTLNEKEFKDRWKPDTGESGVGDAEGLYYDPDTELENDNTTWLQVWEWHGKVPDKDRQIECCVTLITDKGSDDPLEGNGLLCRLTLRPYLDSGLRPFVTSHHIQRPGCFGLGIIEREEDILYQLSQFIGQAQDNARLTSNPIFLADLGSPAWNMIKDAGGVLSPGMIIPRTPGDPNSAIEAAKLPPFPSTEISSMVTFLNNTLERHTSVSDNKGKGGDAQTATEASILQSQSSVPTRTRTHLFSETFLNEAFNLALAMLSQFTLDDQRITIRGADGRDIPLVITVEELQSQKYQAVATLSRQDHTTIAKAQSIERAIPILMNLTPVLQAQGSRIDFSELVTRYMDLLGVEGADRIIQRLTPEEMAAQQQQLQLQQGGQGLGRSMVQGRDGYSPESAAPPGGVSGSHPPPGAPPVSQPSQLVTDGGPMGQEPTDQNAMAQFLQLQALKQQGGFNG